MSKITPNVSQLAVAGARGFPTPAEYDFQWGGHQGAMLSWLMVESGVCSCDDCSPYWHLSGVHWTVQCRCGYHQFGDSYCPGGTLIEGCTPDLTPDAALVLVCVALSG